MARQKTCSKCDKTKAIEAFPPRGGRCRDCIRAYGAAWARENRAKKPSTYKPRPGHGISAEEYDRLFEQQDGRCLICRQTERARDWRNQRAKRLAVDTDHETGEVRGLLCQRCNMSLGLMTDDPDRMFAAMQYLGNPTERANGGNWNTLSGVLEVVEGIPQRLDTTSDRIDRTLDGQRTLSEQMTQLHAAMHDLRETTNEALHGMENRIKVLEMPWKLIGNGWLKAGAFAGAASAITTFIMKFGVPVHWPF